MVYMYLVYLRYLQEYLVITCMYLWYLAPALLSLPKIFLKKFWKMSKMIAKCSVYADFSKYSAWRDEKLVVACKLPWCLNFSLSLSLSLSHPLSQKTSSIHCFALKVQLHKGVAILDCQIVPFFHSYINKSIPLGTCYLPHPFHLYYINIMLLPWWPLGVHPCHIPLVHDLWSKMKKNNIAITSQLKERWRGRVRGMDNLM